MTPDSNQLEPLPARRNVTRSLACWCRGLHWKIGVKWDIARRIRGHDGDSRIVLQTDEEDDAYKDHRDQSQRRDHCYPFPESRSSDGVPVRQDRIDAILGQLRVGIKLPDF